MSSSATFVATLFSRSRPPSQSRITDDQIASFIELIPLSWPHSSISSHSATHLSKNPSVVEVTVSQPHTPAPHTSILPHLVSLRRSQSVLQWQQERSIEVVLQTSHTYKTPKKLAVFDMDSTLIQQEVIDLLAATIHIAPQVSAITARAMNGELDFEASLRERCALLRGVRSDIWESLKRQITFSPGARDLITVLKAEGYTTAVLSGGFMPLAEWLRREIGLDYAQANRLVVGPDGRSLTGELLLPIVHAERKAGLVKKIAELEGISPEHAVVVGDGANDLPMMNVAGLGVAFHAKPKVQLEAPARLNGESLLEVLFLLGISRERIDEILEAERKKETNGVTVAANKHEELLLSLTDL